MAWGGGFGPPIGGGGRAGAPVGSLPFGGIPSELQSGVDALLADEPEHPRPALGFSQVPDASERQTLSLSTRACWWPE